MVRIVLVFNALVMLLLFVCMAAQILADSGSGQLDRSTEVGHEQFDPSSDE
jgi:hypothetical protein